MTADSASPTASEGKPRVSPEAAALYQQGNQRAQAGEFAAAAEFYRQAVALSPNFAEAFNNLANAQRIQGDLPAAVESYQRCLAVAPHIAQIHRNLATTLLTLNRAEEACHSLARGPRSKRSIRRPATRCARAKAWSKIPSANRCWPRPSGRWPRRSSSIPCAPAPGT